MATGTVGQVRLSRVIGAMSYALDVTEGESSRHAVRAGKIGVRVARVVGLDAGTRSRLFALLGANDHVAKRSSKRVDWSERLPAFA